MQTATEAWITAIKCWGHVKLLCLWLQVQQGSVVAAGAVVTPGKTVPSGEVWAGSPAKLLRKLEEEETGFIAQVRQHHDSGLLAACSCWQADFMAVPACAAADAVGDLQQGLPALSQDTQPCTALRHAQPCGSGLEGRAPLRRRRMTMPRSRRCMRRRTPRLLTRSRYGMHAQPLCRMHSSYREHRLICVNQWRKNLTGISMDIAASDSASPKGLVMLSCCTGLCGWDSCASFVIYEHGYFECAMVLAVNLMI